MTPDFVLIDDDDICNMLTEMMLKNIAPESNVHLFNNPFDGWDYLKSIADKEMPNPLIIFLDINMPGLSGWDILDNLKLNGNLINKNCKVYMLTSSIDPKDKEMANNHDLVKGFFVKPLINLNLKALIEFGDNKS